VRVHLAPRQPGDGRGRRGGLRYRRREQVPLPGAEGARLDLAGHDAGAEGRSPAGADRLRHRRTDVRPGRVRRRRGRRLGGGRAQGELPPAVEPEAGVDADGPGARGRLVRHVLRRAQGPAPVRSDVRARRRDRRVRRAGRRPRPGGLPDRAAAGEHRDLGRGVGRAGAGLPRGRLRGGGLAHPPAPGRAAAAGRPSV
ncbi:MAG: Acetyltransferase, GNAT family, partial [uncultured Solirubrobacteraceae bacterium]